MLVEKKDSLRVVFIHGRPSGHPIHMEYAKLLNADFHFEDYYLGWLDSMKTSKIRRYLSWVLNAFFFPNKNKYDVFFCECLRVPPLIMKKIGLMSSNQKLVALMADESLYFLDQGKYSWLTKKLIKSFLHNCDVIFCIGDLQYDLAIKHTKMTEHSKIVKIYNGIDLNFQIKLNNVVRSTDKTVRFFVVANLSASWRAWYKGVDIAIAAFIKVAKIQSNIELTIIGEINEEVKKELIKNVPQQFLSKIIFMGLVNNIEVVFNKFDLCIHVSRGDAFPTSTLESMSAGIPVVLSKYTGTRSLVELIDKALVVNVDIEETYTAIMYYINLSELDKLKLKTKNKEIVKDYNSSITNKQFVNLFYGKILNFKNKF